MYPACFSVWRRTAVEQGAEHLAENRQFERFFEHVLLSEGLQLGFDDRRQVTIRNRRAVSEGSRRMISAIWVV